MYTFISMKGNTLIDEIKYEEASLTSDQGRLVLAKNGIIYMPNYEAMETLAEVYYRGEEIPEKLTFIFYAIREQADYVTDVNGKKALKGVKVEMIHLSILSSSPLIHINFFGFLGTAKELLRRHGLLYFHKGINALSLTE